MDRVQFVTFQTALKYKVHSRANGSPVAIQFELYKNKFDNDGFEFYKYQIVTALMLEKRAKK